MKAQEYKEAIKEIVKRNGLGKISRLISRKVTGTMT